MKIPRLPFMLATAALSVVVQPVSAQRFHTQGLILRLDASDVDGNGSSKTNPADGTRLRIWKDKSGRGNHVTQADTARQPRLKTNGLSGRSTVRFDGNSVLQRTRFAGLKTGDRPFHVFIVMRAAMHPGHRNQRLLDLSSVDRSKSKPSERIGFWIGYQGNGRNRLGIHNGDEGEAKSVVWSNSPQLLEVVYDGAQNWRQFLNGTDDGHGTFGSRTFLGFRDPVRLSIGQHFGITPKNTFLKGDVAEILIYDRPLKPAEQNSVGSYLARKYRLRTAYGPLPMFEKDIRPILKPQ